jgi:hypothetical protein
MNRRLHRLSRFRRWASHRGVIFAGLASGHEAVQVVMVFCWDSTVMKVEKWGLGWVAKLLSGRF